MEYYIRLTDGGCLLDRSMCSTVTHSMVEFRNCMVMPQCSWLCQLAPKLYYYYYYYYHQNPAINNTQSVFNYILCKGWRGRIKNTEKLDHSFCGGIGGAYYCKYLEK